MCESARSFRVICSAVPLVRSSQEKRITSEPCDSPWSFWALNAYIIPCLPSRRPPASIPWTLFGPFLLLSRVVSVSLSLAVPETQSLVSLSLSHPLSLPCLHTFPSGLQALSYVGFPYLSAQQAPTFQLYIPTWLLKHIFFFHKLLLHLTSCLSLSHNSWILVFTLSPCVSHHPKLDTHSIDSFSNKVSHLPLSFFWN